jgi:hypothetical protein
VRAFVPTRLDRKSLLVLAVLAVLAACGAGSRAPAGLSPIAQPPAAPPVAPVAAPHAGAPEDPAGPAGSLSAADCRAFHAAPALGAAVVASVTPDCSGVGHNRIVIEVRSLARGQHITTIVTSQPLIGPVRGELAVGDTLVVAIDPAGRPAETVYCVPLPAHEGVLRHALEVDSLDTARRVLDELAAGRACVTTPAGPGARTR